jgi:hypothetical protein
MMKMSDKLYQCKLLIYSGVLVAFMLSGCTSRNAGNSDQAAISGSDMIATAPDGGIGIHNGDIGLKLWGPNNRLTFSIGKTDVWDRRWMEKARAVTLDDLKKWAKMDNPSEMWGEGKHYKAYAAYDFPCPKPVGQLIIGLPGEAGKWVVKARQDSIPGVLTLKAINGDQLLNLRVYVHSSRNIIVFEGDVPIPIKGVWIRLYRHFDTSKLGNAHLGEYSKTVCETYDYTKDQGNGPIELPTSGHDKGIGWITQVFPGEPTFPEGFRYTLAAISSLGHGKIKIIKGKEGLGTSAYSRKGPWSTSNYVVPDYQPINEAKGTSVTFTFPRVEGQFRILATVVSSTDTAATLSMASSRLQEALSESPSARFTNHIEGTRNPGYPFLTRKWNGYYGFVPSASWFYSLTSSFFPGPSWCDFYCAQDETPWHGDFHFDEQQYSRYYFVSNQQEKLEPYYQLVEKLLPLAQKYAREAYNMPGCMFAVTHFPIRTDRVINCTVIWEQIMEITALTLKPFWEHYLYTGDKEFLRNRSYKLLREGALFYAAYLTLEKDGFYHVCPTVSPEHWGLTKNFERNKDSQSALTLIKYHLKAAAQAAEILGVDKKDREIWRRIAFKMAPYPTYETPEGPIFVDVLGAPPIQYNIGVPITAICWGDDITLESSPEVLAIARRTLKNIKCGESYLNLSRCLLGDYPENSPIGPENLLQSRGGWIRVFPAVPENYTGSFKNYLAIGAFQVSATSNNGFVKDLSIYSRAGNTCQLVNPWPDKAMIVRESARIKKSVRFTGSHIEFRTDPNTTYQIVPASDKI